MQKLAFMQFSVRHSHCRDLLMTKTFVFECGRIVQLHMQSLSQRTITDEASKSKTVIVNFLKDPEGYGTKMSRGKPKQLRLEDPTCCL